MILDVRPEPDDIRDALRRHIDYPAVPGSAKANGPRLDRDACGGPSAPAPADPVPSTLPPSCPSMGAVSDGAGALNDPLERAEILAAVDAALAGDGPIGFPAPQPYRFNPLEEGRVWEPHEMEPARSRALRRSRIRHALIVALVGAVLAGAGFTLVMALVNAPNNVGR